MIIPDSNLLLYAYNQDSVFHAKAAAWWRQCLAGRETVGLAPAAVFGFVRVATHPRAVQVPQTASAAAAAVRSWLAQPVVRVLAADGLNHLEGVLRLTEQCGTAGDLVSDAQIAALALANNALVHTSDADFSRFPGLRWFNPLTGRGSQRR